MRAQHPGLVNTLAGRPRHCGLLTLYPLGPAHRFQYQEAIVHLQRILSHTLLKKLRVHALYLLYLYKSPHTPHLLMMLKAIISHRHLLHYQETILLRLLLLSLFRLQPPTTSQITLKHTWLEPKNWAGLLMEATQVMSLHPKLYTMKTPILTRKGHFRSEHFSERRQITSRIAWTLWVKPLR
jgi:hypothetical protein